MLLIQRAGWWLLLRRPPARAVRLGMVDGRAGLTPQSDGYYYMNGYAIGRARLLRTSQEG